MFFVAFALSAAGAVDGADIMVVIACRHIRRVGGQLEDIHGGVQASPLSGPLVVGPVGADGAEVFLTTVISLEEEDDGAFRQTHKMFANHKNTQLLPVFNSKPVLHSYGVGFERCICISCIVGSVDVLSLTQQKGPKVKIFSLSVVLIALSWLEKAILCLSA